MTEKAFVQKSSIRNKILAVFILVIIIWGISVSAFMDHSLSSILAQKGLERDIINEIAKKFTMISTGLTLAGIAVFVFIAVFISRTISRPIDIFTTGVMGITEGQSNVKIDITSDDEIGRLAVVFNKMTESLENTTVSRDYVDNIISSMPDPLIVVSPEGTIQTVNSAACTLLEYEENNLIGQPFGTIFGEAVSPGKPVLDELSFDSSAGTHEKTFSTRKGKKIPVLFSSSVMRNKKGDIQGFVCVARDISGRKKYEDELKRSKEFNETVLNSMEDAFSIIDVHNFRILGTNTKFLKGVGLKEEEVLGKTCHEVTHHRTDPCTPPDDICPLMETMTTGEHSSAEHVHYDSAGRKAHVEVATSPIKDGNGNVVRVVHVARDISKRKKSEEDLKAFAEKLEQSHKELQEFLRIASHDLQEPLRKIMTLGNRIETKYAGSLDDQGRDYLKRLYRASERMQVIIYDLRVFTQITTRNRPFESVDLGALAWDVVADLQGRIELTGGRVDVENLPTLYADPLQIRQLLQNLIHNGLKFHKNGESPTVTVSGEFISENEYKSGGSVSDNRYYRLTVEDNGIGFDNRYAERIFGLFQRLHSRDEYEGTGIGLSMCKKIAECHGGSITAESIPGQGAKFIVTLPVKQINGGSK